MSSAIKNYYKILRVDPSAEDEIITAAYRRLALMYHPDVNRSPEATAYFQEINEAYDVLHDPVKRRKYDREQATQASAQRPPDDATGYQEPPQQAAPSQEDTTSTGQDTYDEDDTHAGEESAHGQETEDEPEPADQPENIGKVYRMPDANVWSMVFVLIPLLGFLIPFFNMVINESRANTSMPSAPVLPTVSSQPNTITLVEGQRLLATPIPSDERESITATDLPGDGNEIIAAFEQRGFEFENQPLSLLSGQIRMVGFSPTKDLPSKSVIAIEGVQEEYIFRMCKAYFFLTIDIDNEDVARQHIDHFGTAMRMIAPNWSDVDNFLRAGFDSAINAPNYQYSQSTYDHGIKIAGMFTAPDTVYLQFDSVCAFD